MITADAFLPLAHALADAAGDAIRPWFRTRLDADHKSTGSDAFAGHYSPVTAADRAAEETMRALLDREVPRHGILGEEFGTKEGTDWRWVLDPVDGTRSFLCGLLSWGTLIGLEHQGTPVLGMVDQPITGERWWATPSGGYWRWQGQTNTLHSRPCARLEDAVLCITHPSMMQGEDRVRFERLAQRVRMVRYGTDCIGYALTATGHVDLVVEAMLQPYDIVAHIPIVQAAGGLVTDWRGASTAGGGHALAAGDPSLHAQALALLQP